MSRKGKLPVAVPKNVEVKIDGGLITVKGPKGTLSQEIKNGIAVKFHNQEIEVVVAEDAKNVGNFHGLYRAIVYNMVEGVSQGFVKRLEMKGVGYRAAVQGRLLDIQIGLSHELKLDIPEHIQVVVEKNNQLIISGPDKQRVGQFAATIRLKKKPEPYQGKGIHYLGEYVRRKAGKAAAKK